MRNRKLIQDIESLIEQITDYLANYQFTGRERITSMAHALKSLSDTLKNLYETQDLYAIEDIEMAIESSLYAIYEGKNPPKSVRQFVKTLLETLKSFKS